MWGGKKPNNKKCVSKNCCNCLYVLKVYVPFSPPPLHPHLWWDRQVLISEHKTGFLAPAMVWFHPLRQWDYFFLYSKALVFGPRSFTLNWCQSLSLPVLFLRVILESAGLWGWVWSPEWHPGKGEGCGNPRRLCLVVLEACWQKQQNCEPGDVGTGAGTGN